MREIGPLEKKVLERHQQMQSAKDEGSAPAYRDAANPSNEMNSRLSSILANEEHTYFPAFDLSQTWNFDFLK